MRQLAEPLAKEYARWCKIVGDDDPYEDDVAVGIHDVLRAHFLVADYFYKKGEGIGGIGVKNMDLLHSAMSRQSVSYAGKNKWSENHDICATLFFGLIKNHAFHDSNKRTAFLTALYQLQRMGRTPKVKQKEFEDLTVRVAANELTKYKKYERFKKKGEDGKVAFIGDFLRRKTREVDKRYYVVTYQELNKILGGFGCTLDNPKNNYIDIFVMQKRRRYLGLVGPREEKRQRVGQIGFPGWTAQVGRGAIKTVRTACGLTPSHGIDSEAFFKGADPLQMLIETFHGPLRRLADK